MESYDEDQFDTPLSRLRKRLKEHYKCKDIHEIVDAITIYVLETHLEKK